MCCQTEREGTGSSGRENSICKGMGVRESQVCGGNVESQKRRLTQEIGSITMEKALCEVKGFDMPLPGPGPRFPVWHLFLNACLLGFCGADWSNLWEKKRKHQESS